MTVRKRQWCRKQEPRCQTSRMNDHHFGCGAWLLFYFTLYSIIINRAVITIINVIAYNCEFMKHLIVLCSALSSLLLHLYHESQEYHTQQSNTLKIPSVAVPALSRLRSSCDLINAMGYRWEGEKMMPHVQTHTMQRQIIETGFMGYSAIATPFSLYKRHLLLWRTSKHVPCSSPCLHYFSFSLLTLK